MSAPIGRRAVVLSLTDPHSAPSGGHLRTLGLVQAIEQAGLLTQVVFPSEHGTPGTAAALGGSSGRFARMKRSLLPMPTQAGARSTEISRKLREIDAELAVVGIFSQAQFLRHGRRWRWLDFTDLWSAAAAREAQTRRGLTRWSATAQSSWLAHREVTYCGESSLVTAAGWADREALRRRGIDAHWLPVSLPDDSFALVPTEVDTRVIGLVATFSYHPNVDAYQRLLAYWLPEILRQGWRVLVAGVGSESLTRPPEGVEIMGPVEDLDDFYGRVSAVAVPVTLGGGIKVKVIEALSKGKAVVATPFAIEGLSPAIREMCRTVDPNGSTMPLLDHLVPVDPADPRLDPLRQSTADAAVTRLLADMTNPRTGQR